MAKKDDVTQDAADGLGPVLGRNILSLARRRAREEADAPREERVAAAITAFAGSMRFVYIHLGVVAAWVVINLGWTPLPRFDPSFVILATAASVEAIFLSTFVLISQNRASAMADRRAKLDLQINLLSEREITSLVTLVRAIGAKLDVAESADPRLDEAERRIAPDKVLDRLDAE